jgi:hypothetical protein
MPTIPILFRTLGVLLLGACTQTSDSGDCDVSSDADGDGIDDCAELAAGLDPDLTDSDGDGDSDSDELDCGSDPLDEGDTCYACGWERRDPGNLESTGNAEGDVIANLQFIDQCEEEVALWEFAEEYHILWMTASW